MKKHFLVIFLFTGIAGFSQTANKTDSNGLKKGRDVRKLILTDSMISKLLIKKDSATAAYRASDSIEKQENISRNMNGILQLQKERNAKEKRGAFLRIGIGISFLVLLFIGLRRRKK